MNLKKLVLVSLMTAALAACGGKSKGGTTPSNTGGTAGSASMGGTGYGGSTGSAAAGSAAPMPSAGGDPCGG